MYTLKQHDIPIEQTGGHSSYIRLRFLLDKYPSSLDAREYVGMAYSWLWDCQAGKFLDKKMKILSFNAFFKYHLPVFEVDFDIVNESPQVIDELIEILLSVSHNPDRQAHLQKAIIGYYNLG